MALALTMHREGPFKVGDLVTRDGSDVHLVVGADEDGWCIDVECIEAPSTGWISVGETECNLGGRYLRVTQDQLDRMFR